MEFNEKLQQLRKQNQLTQEELAAALYVSRTAVSKWESGRGYPGIESLKAIARYFSVTVDELLSGDEVLALAEEDSKRSKSHLCDVLFGLLDCSTALLFFFPFFGQKTEEMIRSVSLLSLTDTALYLRILYVAVVAGIVLWGLLTLALQNLQAGFWKQYRQGISFALNAVGVLLFTVSLQPYAASLLFVFLLVKSVAFTKR